MKDWDKDIKSVLGVVKDPQSGTDLMAVSRVLRIAQEEKALGVVLEFASDTDRDILRTLRDLAEKTIGKAYPYMEVSVVASRAPKAAPAPSGAPKSGPAPTMPSRPTAPTPEEIPGVKHIVAVASGKGGVGKSTTSLNLAMALKQAGLKVGLLDADIYGPSQPHLLGVTKKPTTRDGKLVPIEAHGLTTMSVGFLIDVDHAVVWRGPRVMGATRQMLKDCHWGDLDVMIIDLPPGTGDVQLTLVQQVPLSGAVIVSTPQDLALIDARKGISMFKQVGAPILGLIENMSIFCCPNCGEETAIFGTGGAKETAESHGIPFLGALPLAPKIRASADSGTPLLVSDPDGPEAALYKDVAAALQKTLAL